MIEIADLRFGYGEGGFLLDVPSLRIDRGEHAAFIGPSGSGKTTLVYLIAGILRADAGSIRIGETELHALSDDARRAFRISRIGFVFQEFELLDYLSVRDNILLPYYLNPALELTPRAEDAALALADSVGLGDKLRRFPRTLSQGERQRVAICRALATGPELLIADEPTGNLDPRTAQSILNLLLAKAAEHRSTLLVVTHNHALLGSFGRVVDMADLVAAGAHAADAATTSAGSARAGHVGGAS